MSPLLINYKGMKMFGVWLDEELPHLKFEEDSSILNLKQYIDTLNDKNVLHGYILRKYDDVFRLCSYMFIVEIHMFHIVNT